MPTLPHVDGDSGIGKVEVGVQCAPEADGNAAVVFSQVRAANAFRPFLLP